MNPPEVATVGAQAEGRLFPWRLEVPSWLVSAVLHMIVLIVLGLTFRLAPRPASSGERTAEVGIVLKAEDGERSYYVGEESGGPEALAAAETTSHVASLADALSDSHAIDPSQVLPRTPNSIGPSALEHGALGHAGKASKGPGVGPGKGLGGGEGKVRTSIFNVEAEGSRFVYVFDRSASMEGTGLSPLDAAKAEMLASIDSLDRIHQFQIIFYNERPWIFNPAGDAGRLAFATEQNKTKGKRFIGSITADGGTRHEEAIEAAIRLQPDVIFFLTDGDEPRLSRAQLDQIHRRAGGISINAIEFGMGPKPGGGSFLEVLAAENGGQYGYVDITRFRSRR